MFILSCKLTIISWQVATTYNQDVAMGLIQRSITFLSSNMILTSHPTSRPITDT